MKGIYMFFPDQYKDVSQFEQILCTTHQVPDKKELPFDRIDHLFKIFSEKTDFTFDDKEERLSDFLVRSACLYFVHRPGKVCFISPTTFYAQQAMNMIKIFTEAYGGRRHPQVPVTVPTASNFEEVVGGSEVVFMHGADYSSYLPPTWKGRKVIQIFPGEMVPVDAGSYSKCSHYGDNS